MTEPEQPEQPSRPADVDPELLRRKQEVQLADWQARKAAELEVYRANQQALDVAEPQTMRQQIAWAREMVESGLIPAGWTGAKPGAVLNERQVEKAARAVVLAVEWGKHLGFAGFAALQHLQVVEGNVGVKPKSARGMILGKGHDLDDETEYSAAGFPVAHTVTITRNGGKPKSFTFRVEDALQAELISEIMRDTAGQVIGVVARSDRGNPLSWEKYTARMLTWRATSGMVALYAMDFTGGMDLAPEMEEPTVRSGPAPLPTAVAATIERVAPAPADEYDPGPDLSLIEDATGRAPAPWWEQADAPSRLGVKRRNRVQVAADRVSEWVLAHMAEADDLMPPGLTRTAESWLYVTPESEALDAEVVDEEDMAGPGLMEADDDPPAHLMGTDAVPDPYDDPDAAQWRPIQDVTIPDEIKPEPDPAPAATPPASRDDLLAVVEVLASRAGKTAAQYTARAVLGLRRNVEDWTAEELADFIAAQAPDLELAELLGA